MSVSIFDSFLTTPDMIAVFDDAAVVQAMFSFEAALAGAQTGHIQGDLQCRMFEKFGRPDPFSVIPTGRFGSPPIPHRQTAGEWSPCNARSWKEALRLRLALIEWVAEEFHVSDGNPDGVRDVGPKLSRDLRPFSAAGAVVGPGNEDAVSP